MLGPTIGLFKGGGYSKTFNFDIDRLDVTAEA